MGHEEKVKDRKTLKEAVEAARLELAGKRKALAKAEETCMFTSVTAAKGGAKERGALRVAEDAVVRLREEVAIAAREARQRETELEQLLARDEGLDSAGYARRLKEDRIKVAELSALLRQRQEQGVAIAKEMVALVIEAERRVPQKLVARRCNRVVTVDVLDEDLQKRYGKTTRMGFFAARKEADAGRMRIIPDERLTLSPEDFEYEKRTAPLPADLEVVRMLNLGLMFGEADQRKELTFEAIVSMLEEDEDAKAAKAAGRKS